MPRRAKAQSLPAGGSGGFSPLPNLVGSPVSTRAGKSTFFSSIALVAASRNIFQIFDGVPAPNIFLPLVSFSSTFWVAPPTQTVAESCGTPPTNQQSPLPSLYSQVPDLAM